MNFETIIIPDEVIDKWNSICKNKSDNRSLIAYKIARNIVLGNCVKEFSEDSCIIRNWDMNYVIECGIITYMWRSPNSKLVKVDRRLKKNFDLMYKNMFVNNEQYQ